WIARTCGASTRIGFKGHKGFRNKRLYNMTVDVAANLHQIDRNLDMAKAFGCRRLFRNPEIFLTGDELERARAMVTDAGEKYVLLHPGARRWYKSWPLEYFAALGDEIIGMGLGVVIDGGPDDVESAAKIEGLMKERPVNLAGKTTIRDLAAITKGAAIFVGNDSAPMHISYAVGTPTIALFGPTDWKTWHPLGEKHMVFVKDVECSPCGHTSDCDKGEENCMRLITVSEVRQGVEMMLVEKEHSESIEGEPAEQGKG
ncbi:MAG: glycosyltransferase family 9 protein, partial [Thermodesulfobacteriota bacterium]